jgi:hypothetical protein
MKKGRHTTFRLSKEAKELLRADAEKHGVSMTARLEMLIRKGCKG